MQEKSTPIDYHGKGGVFRELESPEFFRQVRVAADAGTIIWPNGVDFCPLPDSAPGSA